MTNSGDERHEAILHTLKQQVKAIMEEAVTKKFVHEESALVLRLCGTVEMCLLDGMKKRIAGFLRVNRIASLYTKVAKAIPEVNQLITKIEELESTLESAPPNGNSLTRTKFLWVRMALTSKLLAPIVEHLHLRSSKFYEKSSIMADQTCGKIISHLLVGVCALDFTKMKTHDHYWSDPPAGELLLRHKLHNRNSVSNMQPGPRLPSFSTTTRSRHSSGSTNQDHCSEKLDSFRDYVESLHQNSKMTLLYGKNNVLVQPVSFSSRIICLY